MNANSPQTHPQAQPFDSRITVERSARPGQTWAESRTNLLPYLRYTCSEMSPMWIGMAVRQLGIQPARHTRKHSDVAPCRTRAEKVRSTPENNAACLHQVGRCGNCV